MGSNSNLPRRRDNMEVNTKADLTALLLQVNMGNRNSSSNNNNNPVDSCRRTIPNRPMAALAL